MSQNVLNDIVIFTDGACTGNPGPGGWGAVVAFPEGRIKELGGGDPATTNNRMEILASIKALQYTRDRTETTHIYTDSVYLIRGITEWIWAWRRRGWVNAEGGEISNQDLWRELSRLVADRKEFGLHWHYVRGHIGIPGNERTDEIAVSFAKGRSIDLFDGSLLQYTVPIYDLPEQLEDLPAMKSKAGPKPKAHSYLSVVGGTVMRHRDWASCERRVKGQSGARFKKALSAANEAEILKSWGLDPAKVTIEDV